jgi:hypothetical protein
MYLISLAESSTIVITWLTTDYTPINGVLAAYKCSGDGSRTQIASTPIINGESILNINLINNIYSFDVIIDGQIFQDLLGYSKCHSESTTTAQYYVSINPNIISPFLDFSSLSCNMTNQSGNIAYMQWEDSDLDITGCIYADRISGTGLINIYSDCDNSTNYLARTITNSGYQYQVYGKLFYKGYSRPCGNPIVFYQEAEPSNIFGNMLLFGIFIIICAISLIFAEEGGMWIVFASLGIIILFWSMGLLLMDMSALAAILFLGIIVVWIIKGRKTA